ncbi:MAG: hypothetical protein K9L59_13100 [Desulfobacterales bacterium]|nr:hypothetical protein [Desulfobacterales bacterium]
MDAFAELIDFPPSVQFAKAAGTRVIATASAGNRETLLELGADVAVDYKEQDAADIRTGACKADH